MPTYLVTRKSDGQQVYEYQHSEALDMDLFPFTDYDHIEKVEPPTPAPTTFGGRRTLTKLEFIALLGMPAYVAILSMAKQSIQVEAWVKMLDLATPDANQYSVNLDDERTAAGIQDIGAALEQVGAVQPGWAQGVLNG